MTMAEELQRLRDTTQGLLAAIERLANSCGDEAFEETLTTSEALKVLGVHKATLFRKAKPAYCIGGENRYKLRDLSKCFRLPDADLLRMLRNHRADAQEQAVPV